MIKAKIKLYQRKLSQLKCKIADFVLIKVFGREYLIDFVMDNYQDYIDDIYNEPPDYYNDRD